MAINMDSGQDKIASNRLSRAGKLLNAGVKVGGNYMKHYAKGLVNKNTNRDELDQENATDVYKAFSELKGGPLKLAQMLSLGEQILPKAYTEQFAQAQNRVTPLSYPLIRKTFKSASGEYPEESFDEFSRQAVNAASIGQVHKGRIGEKEYAIKLQYPGVADSLVSDIRMIAPVATRMFGLKKDEIQPYLEEVQAKLLEETDYRRELENAERIIQGCKSIEGLVFPEFDKNRSGDRVLTMTWLDGLSLSDWIKTNPSQELRNSIGQRLWDFYQHQIHQLRVMHADPHPGNFIITPEVRLGIIDFGCIKEIPDDFYDSYTKLLSFGSDLMHPDFLAALIDLGLYDPNAPENERRLVMEVFSEMFTLVGKPLMSSEFDFGDDTFFKQIFTQGEAYSKRAELRGLSARGSRHFIYFNRTYFGLYQLLNQLKAHINTHQFGIENSLKKSA